MLRLKFCQDLEVEVQFRFWGWRLGNILSHKFGRDLKAEIGLRFRSWILTNLSSHFGESRQPLGMLCLRQYSIRPQLCFVDICVIENVTWLLGTNHWSTGHSGTTWEPLDNHCYSALFSIRQVLSHFCVINGNLKNWIHFSICHILLHYN